MQEYDLFGMIEVLAGIATAGAFIIAVYSYNSFRKAEELKLAESIFRDIRELERQKYQLSTAPTENEKLKDWASLFFNTLEWFSFLVNTHKLKDSKTINFFKDSMIDWYEELFLDPDYIETWQVEDSKQYVELKKLYKKYKEIG